MVESSTKQDLANPAYEFSPLNSEVTLVQADSRPQWKRLAASILRWGGVLQLSERVARRYTFSSTHSARLSRPHRAAAPRILILCYHRIGTGGIPLYSELPAHVFEAQMRFLRGHYRVLSLADACKELESPTRTEPAVVVTFDDGYRDLYAQALPILRRYDIPATIYLTVGAIETGQPAWYDRIFLALKHAPGPSLNCEVGEAQSRRFDLPDAASRFRAAIEIVSTLRTKADLRRREFCADLDKRVQLPPAELMNRMLTWQQVRIMQKAGVYFGCHTMTHPAVSRLNASDMETEVVRSKELMEERIAADVFDFAYPFGKSDDCGTEARAVLKRAGYRSAVTTTAGVNVQGTDPYQLLRVDAGQERSLAIFALQLNWCFLRGGANSSSEDPKSQDAAGERPAYRFEKLTR